MSDKEKRLCGETGMNVRVTKVLFGIVFVFAGSCVTDPSAAGQEIFAFGGLVNSEGKNAAAWQLSYEESLSEHFAYSVSWLNEGHLDGHHRDGPTCQFWGRTRLLNDSLSFSAGVGPYLFFDTEQSGGQQYKDIHRGWAGIGSLAATWHTKRGWLIQLRGNYVIADSNINTSSVLLGVGYQFDASPSSNASSTAQPEAEGRAYNEITVLLGGTIINASKKSQTAMAANVEYRRRIFPYLDWTVGWLYEGNMELLRRSGLTTQLWPTKSFFDRRLSLGIGLGLYVTPICRYLTGTDEEDDEMLLGIITPTLSYRFENRWLMRLSWNRTISSHNRDTDVILVGVGYEF